MALPVPQMSRKRWRAVRMLGLLALAVYFLLPTVGLSSLQPSWPLVSLSGPASTHPIDALIVAGQQRWQAKLKRQTKTLAGAVKEYRRRYGRAPPKGFDDWYNFARTNECVPSPRAPVSLQTLGTLLADEKGPVCCTFLPAASS